MSQEVHSRYKTLRAGGALAVYRRVRLAAGVLGYAGAADTDCVGVTNSPALGANQQIPVALMTAQGTFKMVAAKNIAINVAVYAAANGMISDSGTVLVGIALEPAGAINDIIEVAPSPASILGAIARSALTQDALKPYTVPLTQMQATGTGAQLGAAAGTPSGAMGLTVGTYGSATPLVVGEAASGNSKTDYCRFQFTLPGEYDAGETITLRVRAERTGALNVSGTIDASVYLSDGGGGLGSDLCATSVQTVTASFANYDFVVTPTGLVAGDTLDIQLTAVANDTGATNNKLVAIGAVQVLLDVKG